MWNLFRTQKNVSSWFSLVCRANAWYPLSFIRPQQGKPWEYIYKIGTYHADFVPHQQTRRKDGAKLFRASCTVLLTDFVLRYFLHCFPDRNQLETAIDSTLTDTEENANASKGAQAITAFKQKFANKHNRLFPEFGFVWLWKLNAVYQGAQKNFNTKYSSTRMYNNLQRDKDSKLKIFKFEKKKHQSRSQAAQEAGGPIRKQEHKPDVKPTQAELKRLRTKSGHDQSADKKPRGESPPPEADPRQLLSRPAIAALAEAQEIFGLSEDEARGMAPFIYIGQLMVSSAIDRVKKDASEDASNSDTVRNLQDANANLAAANSAAASQRGLHTKLAELRRNLSPQIIGEFKQILEIYVNHFPPQGHDPNPGNTNNTG